MLARIALVPIFTLLFMLAAVISLLPFGGFDALRGPTPLQAWWWLAFPLHALVAGVIAYLVVRLAGEHLDGQSLAVIIVTAWLLELGIAFAGVVPQEFAWADPIDYWAVMTGGPIQPAGAIIGGLIGLGRVSRRQPSAV